MDQWLQNLPPDTAVVVPTRSLANHLTERLSKHYLANQITVWESPNILLWADYLKILWQLNQDQLALDFGVHSLISSQQALILWTQVIESSRRKERALTLLNVQQTSKAVQRSWRLMNDWQVNPEKISQDHVADTQQFIGWIDSYQQLLRKRGFIDEPTLIKRLAGMQYELPFNSLIWYCYDLLTASQRCLNESAIDRGVEISNQALEKHNESEAYYFTYASFRDELVATFQDAWQSLEDNADSAINIVIPDLQHRQAQVREIAREVFYPSLTPLQAQQQNSVYRFSLGEPLQDWPAIEVALLLINLLKNRTKRTEFSFILRNRFLRLAVKNSQECLSFDTWLKRRRLSVISTDQIAELYRECLQDQAETSGIGEHGSKLLPALDLLVEFLANLNQSLANARADSGFAGLSFSNWSSQFDNWLSAWGWSASVAGEEMNSVQFQLRERWLALLQEYALLDAVQGQAGVSRALEVLQQMVSESIFQPQAADSPILISGVYEAIGQQADICYLTGMHQNYPTPSNPDAFIPNRLLIDTGYPDANAISSLEQSKKVITSLLAPAAKVIVSYARENQQNREIENSSSSIFRTLDFIEKAPLSVDKQGAELESYEDIQGPSWPTSKVVKGGSSIFKNQSNCAFKAFVTHRLKFSQDDETEFGLDALDRGNVMHHLLDWLWGEIQTQQNLLNLNESAQTDLINRGIDIVTAQFEEHLNSDKFELLKLEAPRLQQIALDWLAVEVKRPSGFTVLEREEMREGEVGGIGFRYKIDRLDILDDGRTVVIDYKTGNVAKKDWLGERIKDPQLPLYTVALNKEKRKDVSGIAFAQVKRMDQKYEYLSEADIFKAQPSYATKTEDSWKESSAQWPGILENLAKDFLAGQASVNPIDSNVCNYCELSSVCRISQLSDGIFAADGELEESQDGLA